MLLKNGNIRYTELFHSAQGEGKWANTSAIFLRLWGCNLQCAGFGQPDPLDQSTWDLTFRDYDPKENMIILYDELPIFGKGCDSVYSWNAKYKHMAMEDSPVDLANKVLRIRPTGRWGETHLVITGGESLMPANQRAFIELMSGMKIWPKYITFETNGTQELLPEFVDMIEQLKWEDDVEISFSVSVKLRHVTGELHCKTMKPEFVKKYHTIGHHTWLKPVVNNTEGCWNELEEVVHLFRSTGLDLPVYVMPVGASEDQQNQDHVRPIVEKALSLGYHISLRAHIYIWGNAVGT